MRIYPLYKEVATSGILAETAWAGAAFNLFLYMLASHNDKQIVGDKPVGHKRHAGVDFCFVMELVSGVVLSSTGFSDKFFYCFWWGLRNLSSLGQNLKTSTYVWETCFAVFISISGLVLLMFVTGNFQTHFQTRTARLEEMRIQRRDTEQWKETRGVDEEMPVQNLPRDLSVSSNTSSPSETEKMEEANHAGEDQGNIDHAIIINDGEDQGNEDHAITINGVTS
ncbi:hypothetical protein OIU76_000985 [Salix suchowensis]|nr:hypothetical protein OIU76_000985 [Salix suchowensis]